MTTRLAMLTPSSNTVVEPWTARMALALPDITVHFARTEVLWIDDGAASVAQFDDTRMLEACTLLSHVRPATIGWNGTAASWLGFDRDRALVKSIEDHTGCRAVTSTLAILEALSALGTSQIGLVTPYVSQIQEQIVANFEAMGTTCVAERHFGVSDNFAIGTVPEAQVADAALAVAAEGAEAVVVLCTNLAGAGVAASVERSSGVPLLDSVVLTLWGSLRAAGQDTTALAPWGPTVAAL